MIYRSETNWLSKESQCECCEKPTKVAYLIVNDDGDEVCEDCIENDENVQQQSEPDII